MAALLAASRCLFSSGSLLPRETVGGGAAAGAREMVGSIWGVGRRPPAPPPWLKRAARMGWMGPNGVVLAPVAMTCPAGDVRTTSTLRTCTHVHATHTSTAEAYSASLQLVLFILGSPQTKCSTLTLESFKRGPRERVKRYTALALRNDGAIDLRHVIST